MADGTKNLWSMGSEISCMILMNQLHVMVDV